MRAGEFEGRRSSPGVSVTQQGAHDVQSNLGAAGIFSVAVRCSVTVVALESVMRCVCRSSTRVVTG